MTYSTPEEIKDFIAQLTKDTNDKSRPMLVLDMDGNFVIGYSLKPGDSLPLQPGDNPERQAIPSDTDVERLAKEGKLERGIFAARGLDVRVPSEVVKIMNANIADKAHPDRKFDIIVLTSRGSEETLKILKESGIRHPNKVTMVADSGANIFVDGKRYDVRSLSKEEEQFLKGIRNHKADLETRIDDILREKGYDPHHRPQLVIEPKGIATNIHYRATLHHYGAPEGSELDKAIGAMIKEEMDRYIAESSPKENGKPVFKTLDAPATVETKIGAVDKGQGLRATIKMAAEHGYRPSAVAYSGDDIVKVLEGKPSPGTDHPAFEIAPQLQEETGIPIYTMHTHHPISGQLHDPDPVPNPEKAASAMGIKPHITVPHPHANAQLIVAIAEQVQAQVMDKGDYTARLLSDRQQTPSLSGRQK